ncbi:hypothetical protein D3C72_429850 [compost metagenome]
MAQNDAQRMLAGRAGIQNIFALFDAERFSTHQARHAHPGQQADNQDDVIHARLEVGVHHQQQEKRRNGHQNIDDAHHQVIEPAAKIAADGADKRADQRGKKHRQKTDHQGDLPAVQGAGEVIAPVFVGAKPVRRVRRQGARAKGHLIWIVRA